MKCSICELAEVETVSEAIEKDWSPCWYDRAAPHTTWVPDQHDPVCPACVAAFLEYEKDSGELVSVEAIADTLLISQ